MSGVRAAALIALCASTAGEQSVQEMPVENEMLMSDSCYADCAESARAAALPIGPPTLPTFLCDARLRDVNAACWEKRPPNAEPQPVRGFLGMYPDYPRSCSAKCAAVFVPYFWGCRAHALSARAPIEEAAPWNPRNGFSGRLQEFMVRCGGTHADSQLLVAPSGGSCRALPLPSNATATDAGSWGDSVATSPAPPPSCCSACRESFDVGSATALVRDGALHRAQFRCKGLSYCYKAYDLVDDEHGACTNVHLFYFTPDDPKGQCWFEASSKPLRIWHAQGHMASGDNASGVDVDATQAEAEAALASSEEQCRAQFFDPSTTDSVVVQVLWRAPVSWQEYTLFLLRSCVTPDFLGPVGTLLFCATYLTLRFSPIACI